MGSYNNMRCVQEWADTAAAAAAAHAQRPHPYDGMAFRPADLMRPSIYLCKNLIINYLPQTFTDKHLFDMFVPYGPLHSVKIMREAKSGYSYGFGFANFIREDDAFEALKALNGFPVENKRLKVSFARPPSDDIKDTNVYITNLPRGTTEKELMELFGPFGNIVQKNLLHDKNTGRCRGTAFVRYDHRDQAAASISVMNHFIPRGATEALRVKLAQDHGKQKAAYLAGFQDALFHRAPSGMVFK